jgi:proline iminopeptidase
MKKSILTSLLFFSAFLTIAQDFDGHKKINGTSLYAKIIGKGEPVLIIHGGPAMNMSYLLPHFKSLARNHRLIFYDQRASGKSAAPSSDSTSLKFLIDDIEALRKDLGIEKLNLLAHSWGALLAVNYGIRFPDNVKSMILVNPVPLSHDYDIELSKNQSLKGSVKDSTDRVIITGSYDFKAGKPDAYRKVLMLAFRNSFYTQPNYKKLSIDIPANYLAASRALYGGLSKDLLKYDFYDAVHSFTFPVLILHGSADVVPLSADEFMQRAIPKSTLVIFLKSGHFVFIEEPKKFKAVVEKFLAGDK